MSNIHQSKHGELIKYFGIDTPMFFLTRYNLRRFGELPYHLINAGRITDLCDHVLFNYHWLHAKISAVPIGEALEDFTRAIRVISSYDNTAAQNSGNVEVLRQVR